MRILFTFLFCFSTLLLCAKEDFTLEHATVSAYAVNLDTGEILIDHNSNCSVIPASCLKVVTTATALYLLGADTRFETTLEYDGTLDPEGTLHGNLYIRGGGDPCLGSERISPSLSWDKQIQMWVIAIQKTGIKKIQGRVIGDASRWEKALAAPSWAWEDLGNYYGAGACALSFNENAYSLSFKPGNTMGEKTEILHTSPPLSHLIFLNEVKTGPEGSGDHACIYGSEFSPIQSIRGTVPAGVDAFTIKGMIPDPPTFTANLLQEALEDKGIVIEQCSFLSSYPRTTFHTTSSPTIGEIIHWTNQKSINLYAEHLLKKMGEVVYREGSTDAGTRAIMDFWKKQKMDLDGFNMVDGSGLSRKNLITAKQCVFILQKMKKSADFPLFFQSLPRVCDLIRAKSGSMSLIEGWVGYAGSIGFAILFNQSLDIEKREEKLKLFFSQLRDPL